jgi:hypothetical protein
MGWSLVARIDRVRESQFEDTNEAHIGAHGESTETAPLRFFGECTTHPRIEAITLRQTLS